MKILEKMSITKYSRELFKFSKTLFSVISYGMHATNIRDVKRDMRVTLSLCKSTFCKGNNIQCSRSV